MTFEQLWTVFGTVGVIALLILAIDKVIKVKDDDDDVSNWKR
jgi:hypothetical protein